MSLCEKLFIINFQWIKSSPNLHFFLFKYPVFALTMWNYRSKMDYQKHFKENLNGEQKETFALFFCSWDFSSEEKHLNNNLSRDFNINSWTFLIWILPSPNYLSYIINMNLTALHFYIMSSVKVYDLLSGWPFPDPTGAIWVPMKPWTRETTWTSNLWAIKISFWEERETKQGWWWR